jgi:hypothetical protein
MTGFKNCPSVTEFKRGMEFNFPHPDGTVRRSRVVHVDLKTGSSFLRRRIGNG